MPKIFNRDDYLPQEPASAGKETLSVQGRKDTAQAVLAVLGLCASAGMVLKNLASPFHAPFVAIGVTLGLIRGFHESQNDIKAFLDDASLDSLAAATKKIIANTFVGAAFGCAGAECCDSILIAADQTTFGREGLALGALGGAVWGAKKHAALPPEMEPPAKNASFAKRFVLGGLLGVGLALLVGGGIKTFSLSSDFFQKASQEATGWTSSTYNKAKDLTLGLSAFLQQKFGELKKGASQEKVFAEPVLPKGSTAMVLDCATHKTGQTFFFLTQSGEKELSCDGPSDQAAPIAYDLTRKTKSGKTVTGVLLFKKDGRFQTLKLD